MTVDKIISGAGTPAEALETGRKAVVQKEKESRAGGKEAALADGNPIVGRESTARRGSAVESGSSAVERGSAARDDAAKSAGQNQKPIQQSGDKTGDKISISGTARAKKTGTHTTIKSSEEADRVASGINEAIAANPDITKIHSFEPDVLQRFSRVIASVFEAQLEAPAT